MLAHKVKKYAMPRDVCKANGPHLWQFPEDSKGSGVSCVACGTMMPIHVLDKNRFLIASLKKSLANHLGINYATDWERAVRSLL